jgi:hypothetical protein
MTKNTKRVRSRIFYAPFVIFVIFVVNPLSNSESLSVQAGSHKLALQIGGGADLIAYVGHDGLMDFSLDPYPKRSAVRMPR